MTTSLKPLFRVCVTFLCEHLAGTVEPLIHCYSIAIAIFTLSCTDSFVIVAVVFVTVDVVIASFCAAFPPSLPFVIWAYASPGDINFRLFLIVLLSPYFNYLQLYYL